MLPTTLLSIFVFVMFFSLEVKTARELGCSTDKRAQIFKELTKGLHRKKNFKQKPRPWSSPCLMKKEFFINTKEVKFYDQQTQSYHILKRPDWWKIK